MRVEDRSGRLWATFVWACVAMALVIDGRVVWIVATNGHFLGDFTVFWTAARIEPDQLYDVHAITVAQQPLVGQPGLRPFVNPPSCLPWLAPFGRLPFIPALLVWDAIGLAVYLAAARQWVRGWGLLIVALSPLVWISAGSGQISLLIGAALLVAVASLPTRPILAGALIGIAATIKPQIVLMAPLALAAAREWKALAAAVITGAGVGLACIAAQGAGLWLDWLAAMRGLPAILEAEGLADSGVSASSFPVPESAKTMTTALGAIFATVSVWLAFARSRDSTTRLICLVAGSLFASPYARKYDLVALQPAATLLLLDRRGGVAAWLIGATGLIAASQPLSAAVLCASAWRSRRERDGGPPSTTGAVSDRRSPALDGRS